MSKVAVITGSGKRRVGNVIAQSLAKDGYDIVLHYNSAREQALETVTELQSMGAKAIAVQADLTNENQVDGLFDQIMETFGRLDALVCSAATWSKGTIEQTDAAAMTKEWRINTLGTYLCCRRAGMMMVGQNSGGCIITIGDWAIVRPYPDHIAYFASKGSLPTLTRTLAVELAARNPQVRVNCILPGPVMLPEDLPESERQAAINATLVKREGTPEHIAHAVRFFLENDFVTGVCLAVDGGRTIHSSDI